MQYIMPKNIIKKIDHIGHTVDVTYSKAFKRRLVYPMTVKILTFVYHQSKSL